MRQVLSTALVALVVGSLAGVTASVIAQTPEEGASSPAATTVANADKVDGKHAVGAGVSKARRAGKLVATDGAGKLPSNIVDPFWGGIKNVPAGFADGIDDGITGLKVTKVNGAIPPALADGYQFAYAFCPTGSVLVGGGAAILSGHAVTHIVASQPGGTTNWFAHGFKEFGTGGTYQIQAYALCLAVDSGGPITTASKGKAANTRSATR